MGSATSGVLLSASFARPLSVFWVCEGSIPNPPTVLAPHVRLGRRQEEGDGKGEVRLTGRDAPPLPLLRIYRAY
jgi:hypothetical protein